MAEQGHGDPFDALQDWLLNDERGPDTGMAAPARAERHRWLPYATQSLGVLGARMDEHRVVLRSGQPSYAEPLFELAAAQPMSLALHSVGQDPHTGYLGRQWRLSFESRLETWTQDAILLLRLWTADGRCFDLQCDRKDGRPIDPQWHGVEVTWQGQDPILRYRDGTEERYHRGRLIRRADANARTTNFLYDARERLTEVRNDCGYSCTLSYNAQDQVADIHDHGGRRWQLHYDAQARLQGLLGPGGLERRYRYAEPGSAGADGMLIEVEDGLGRVHLSLAYDGQGCVARHRTDGPEILYTHHADGGITRTDPDGRSRTFHLNADGLIDQINHADGTREHLHWDAGERLLRLTERSGAVETRRFDERGRLLERRDADRRKTVLAYRGDNPRPVKIATARGIRYFGYDARGNLSVARDEQGRSERFDYDARGNLIAHSDTADRLVRLEYTAAGLPSAVIDAAGNRETFAYDGYGRQIEHCDAAGRRCRVAYDEQDNIIQSDEAHGSTRFRYGPEHLLLAVTDAAGAETRYDYDAAGRLLGELHPGGRRRFALRADGVTVVQREDGSEVQLHHDAEGRLTREVIGAHVTEYAYDDDGRLRRVSAPGSVVELAYTRTGAIDTEIQNGIAVESAHADGQRVHLKFLDTALVLRRNKQGRLDAIDADAAGLIALGYAADDSLTERRYPNGQVERFSYDDLGQLDAIDTAGARTVYRSDASGLILKKGEFAYAYDDSGRLIQAGDSAFAYDAAGNLLNDQARHDRAHRLLETRDYRLDYDARGNLIGKTHKASGAVLRYVYDPRDQLVRVHGEAATAAGREPRDLRFAYDALGRRIAKTEHGITRRYLYDGPHLIAILDGDGQWLASIIHGEQIDEPLCIHTRDGTFYYHRDHQGSIVALSDAAGAVVERFTYDGHYGAILAHDKQVETHNPFAYTGREFDAADLYYYRARYYDPELKRFLSPDPDGLLSGDLNPYRYVGNDPVNWRDPSGRGKGPCAKLEALKKLKKKVLAAAKKLFKRVGKSLRKRIMTTMASLVGGPLAIVAAGANLILTGWDAWRARHEIGELFDAASEGFDMVASGDFSSAEMLGELGEALKGELTGQAAAGGGELMQRLAEACKKKKALDGKDGNKSKGKSKTNKSCPECQLTPGSKPVTYPGHKILGDEEDLDFTIQAPMPLLWQRKYDSSNPRIGLLGQGWTLLADAHLLIRPDKTLYIEPNGRELTFAALEIGEQDRWVVEQLSLSRPAAERYELATADGVRLIFRPGPVPDQTPGKHLLARIEDRNGNGLHYHYNGYRQAGQEDRLTHIQTDDGRLFALGYIERDGDPRLIGVQEWTWAEGQARSGEPQREWLVQYTYSDAGDLIEVRNRTGRLTRQFDYRNHMLVAHKQPGGLESFYTYSLDAPSGKVTRNWTNTDTDLHFDYAEGCTTVTDRDGRVTVYRYDADEYHTGTTDALGQTLTKALDADGLPERIIDEAGGERRLFYDGRGNPTLIKAPDGSALQISYHDVFDLPVAIVDDLGHTTHFAYDARGNLTEHTAADGAVTRYAYDERGLPIRIIDANGGETHLAYTAAGLLSERTDCSGRRTRYRYDRHGNLIEQIDALDQRTRYGYDAEQRLTRIDYPDGAVEQFRYDPLGRLIGYTDPKGHRTTYTLDLAGRPTQRTNALGATLHYDYDRHGRLTRLINENGAAYRFDYDPLDRLKREQGLDGLVTDYRYDPVGNVVEKREHTAGAALRKTRYQRDAAGRLLEKTIAQGEQHSRTRYRYDDIGRLIQARNAHSRIDLGYDPLGRILEETTTSAAGEQRIAHRYDPLGNRTRTDLPDGRSLNWLYYASGHLHQVNLDGEVLCDYERDALHREISRTQGALQSRTGYDPLGRIRRQLIEPRPAQEHGAGAGTGDAGFTLAFNPKQLHLQRRYAYDRAGELVGIDDTRHGNSRYGYDALGRIVHSRLPNLEETFAFDPAHNLLPVGEDGAAQTGRIENNRLRVYQDKRYDYDHFGNLTEKRIGSHTRMQFQYDLEHQLTEAEVTRNGVTQTYRYAYDPFGRRIAKQDAFATTAFLWDGNRLLAETRGSQTKTYVYEQQGFVPVAQLDNDQVRYYHTDHLGTPRELTDTEGEIVWEEVYATWGNTLKKVWQARPAEPKQRLDTQPLRFQGQYFDAETGLHYNRFRYYDPDVGRFVSQDPIGLLGGENLYQYAENPSTWIDPLGLVDVPKTPSGKGTVPKVKRDPKRVWTKTEKLSELNARGGVCDKCGISLGIEDAKGHHIKRHADGGPTTNDNLALLCDPCHKEVHKP